MRFNPAVWPIHAAGMGYRCWIGQKIEMDIYLITPPWWISSLEGTRNPGFSVYVMTASSLLEIYEGSVQESVVVTSKSSIVTQT